MGVYGDKDLFGVETPAAIPGVNGDLVPEVDRAQPAQAPRLPKPARVGDDSASVGDWLFGE